MLILSRPWAEQPQGPVEPASGLDLVVTPYSRFNVAKGSRVVTPYGIALVGTDDNSFQLPANPKIQGAQTVTIQAILYVNGTPSGFTRIFGTRGTTEGDGNRRGWEIGIDGGSIADVLLQVFDSAGSRSLSNNGGSYNGSTHVANKLLLFTATIAITSNTVATCYLKVPDLAETSTTVTVTSTAGTGVFNANVPEVCGKIAAVTTESTYALLALGVREGTITDLQRAEWYANPWQLFEPRRTYLPLATTAASTLPTLSAATYVPGSLTATGFRPRVTATY